MTSPEVERAAFTQARTASAVGREALESSSPGFQPSAMPSQLPTQHFVSIEKQLRRSSPHPALSRKEARGLMTK